MTLSPRSETIGVMESLPSLPIHSSVLFVAIAGLFLAALILRARRLPAQSQRAAGLTVGQARRARRRVQRRMKRRRTPSADHEPHYISGAEVTTLAREGTMSQTTQRFAERGRAEAAAPQFRIHWGRTLLSLTAVVALLVAITTAVLAVAGPLAWTVPALSGGIFLLSMTGLQVSAAARRRRKRRQRVEHAMAEAMNATPQVRDEIAQRQHSASAAAAELGITGKTAPFDALSADTAGHGGPDSLVKLDEDGLPDNADRLFGDQAAKVPQTALAGTAPAESQAAESEAALFDQSTETGTTSWEPREVPHPKYLVAEKAERPEPQPLEAPQSPAPSADTKLKQPAAPAAPQPAEAEVPEAAPSIDLDAVLKRRRA